MSKENVETVPEAIAERAIDAGDHVVALLCQRGRIKRSTSHLAHPVAWDRELAKGKVARLHTYFSWDEALKAVGLEA